MGEWNLYLVLGRARGYLEAQPVGSVRKRYSRRAYERYARVGVDGFAGWRVSPERASTYVRSGVRMVALERLRDASDRLEAALRDGCDEAAVLASEDISAVLEMLAQVPRRVPSTRGGLSRDRCFVRCSEGGNRDGSNRDEARS